MNRKTFLKQSILGGIAITALPQFLYSNTYNDIPTKELIGKGNP